MTTQEQAIAQETLDQTAELGMEDQAGEGAADEMIIVRHGFEEQLAIHETDAGLNQIREFVARLTEKATAESSQEFIDVAIAKIHENATAAKGRLELFATKFAKIEEMSFAEIATVLVGAGFPAAVNNLVFCGFGDENVDVHAVKIAEILATCGHAVEQVVSINPELTDDIDQNFNHVSAEITSKVDANPELYATENQNGIQWNTFCILAKTEQDVENLKQISAGTGCIGVIVTKNEAGEFEYDLANYNRRQVLPENMFSPELMQQIAENAARLEAENDEPTEQVEPECESNVGADAQNPSEA